MDTQYIAQIYNQLIFNKSAKEMLCWRKIILADWARLNISMCGEHKTKFHFTSNTKLTQSG